MGYSAGVKKPLSLSQQIRNAVDDSAMSRYRIAVLAGIDHSQFSGFMSGKRGLGHEALDRLAAVLHLRVVADKERKGR